MPPKRAADRSLPTRFCRPTALASKALSLPMFFEPNQGQTAPQVKFLARGAGYGLFLTADEAVLELQHPALSLSIQPSARSQSQFGDSHAAGGCERFFPRLRRFASAGEEQLLYWQ